MAYRVVSVVIPCDVNENAEWTQKLVSTILMELEVAEVLVITQGDPLSFPLNVNERLRVRRQSDPRTKKVGALNDGLAMSRSVYTLFIDADVLLSGDEISITCQVLEGDGEDEPPAFVSCGYGSKPPNFPLVAVFGGWFAGCKTNVFRDLGGFVDDPLEDVATTQM